MPANSELLLTISRLVRQMHDVTIIQALQRTAHHLSLRRGVGTV